MWSEVTQTTGKNLTDGTSADRCQYLQVGKYIGKKVFLYRIWQKIKNSFL
jgi:hypothetical protein